MPQFSQPVVDPELAAILWLCNQFVVLLPHACFYVGPFMEEM